MYIIIHLLVVFSLFVSPFIFFSAYADEAHTWTVTISSGSSENKESQAFYPDELPVFVGDRVVWQNNDDAIHSITSGIAKNPEQSGLFFDLGEIKPGGSNSFVLKETEYIAYYYFCKFHPWMTGKIFLSDLEIAQPETEMPLILEKTDYSYGEKIAVSGKVHDDFAGTKFTALVYNQKNDLVDISNGVFNQDSTYHKVIDTIGPMWNVDGIYKVKLVYAVPNKVAQASFEFSTKFFTDDNVIPEWIKKVGDYWCNGKIDDAEFVNAVQYLIKNDIIELKNEKTDALLSNEIPVWIKNNACWWAEDKIPDPDFIFGIEYLVNSGIIRV